MEYEQDKFRQARDVLLKSRALLQQVASEENPRLLRFPDHGCTLACEGNEVILALESSRLHWLGRTSIDWGIQQENRKLIQAGIASLQKAEQYDRKLDLPQNSGFEVLRQIPALLYEGELQTAERYLAQSGEVLDIPGKAKGHLYLHQGLAALEEQPKKASDLLESARCIFVEPPFYTKGVSEVFKEISGLYMMDNKKMGDELAIEYALATVILHPYGRNLENLQVAAHKIYWRTGENRTAFERFWYALEERLWRMESGAFSDLRYLMKSLSENGIPSIEAALEMAKQAVHQEMFLL